MHGAFGESGCIGDCAHTGADVAPLASCGLAVKMQINHKRGRLLIVPDQIAHEHIEHVIVDGNGSFETRHHEKDEVRRQKQEVNSSAATPINGQQFLTRTSGEFWTGQRGPNYV